MYVNEYDSESKCEGKLRIWLVQLIYGFMSLYHVQQDVPQGFQNDLWSRFLRIGIYKVYDNLKRWVYDKMPGRVCDRSIDRDRLYGPAPLINSARASAKN